VGAHSRLASNLQRQTPEDGSQKCGRSRDRPRPHPPRRHCQRGTPASPEPEYYLRHEKPVVHSCGVPKTNSCPLPSTAKRRTLTPAGLSSSVPVRHRSDVYWPNVMVWGFGAARACTLVRVMPATRIRRKLEADVGLMAGKTKQPVHKPQAFVPQTSTSSTEVGILRGS